MWAENAIESAIRGHRSERLVGGRLLDLTQELLLGLLLPKI